MADKEASKKKAGKKSAAKKKTAGKKKAEVAGKSARKSSKKSAAKKRAPKARSRKSLSEKGRPGMGGGPSGKRLAARKAYRRARKVDPDQAAPGAAELETEGAPAFEEPREAIVLSPTRAIRPATPLQAYLAEVRNYPLLTREEEIELAKRFQDEGDLQAARRLVTANLRLVVKIALEYYRNWMDLLDLIQEGNLGLMQAVKKFDPYRGIRLSTYSSFWIRAYILKFLMDNWRLVKIGTTQAQRKLFFNLKKEKERLEQFGFKPAPKMLAESLDVKESEVLEMDQRLGSRDESLDQPVTEDGKQTREMVLPSDGPGVDELVAEDEFVAIIKRKLMDFRRTLDQPDREKEAAIFDKRMMSDEPMTLQEVGELFGISRERVRQLESRLIKQLKEYLKKELPDFQDYDFVAE